MPINFNLSAAVPPDGALIYCVCVRASIPLLGYRNITYKALFYIGE